MQPIEKLADPTARTSQRYKQPTPSRGGARPGAGRPKGTTNKITMDGLLTELEGQLGHSYAEQIAINYVSAINRADWGGVRDYDRVLLGKVVADKTQVETVENTEALENKRAAFADALAAIMGVKND
jgi:hypothetical protein